MGDLVNSIPLGSGSGGITTSDDRDGAVSGGRDDSIKGGLGASGKGVILKDTGGAVPEDGLCASNDLGKDLVGLFAAIKSQPAVGDAGLVGGIAGLGGSREAVGGDVVDGEVELNILGLGGLDQLANDLGTILVKERVTNLIVKKEMKHVRPLVRNREIGDEIFLTAVIAPVCVSLSCRVRDRGETKWFQFRWPMSMHDRNVILSSLSLNASGKA